MAAKRSTRKVPMRSSVYSYVYIVSQSNSTLPWAQGNIPWARSQVAMDILLRVTFWTSPACRLEECAVLALTTRQTMYLYICNIYMYKILCKPSAVCTAWSVLDQYHTKGCSYIHNYVYRDCAITLAKLDTGMQLIGYVIDT